MGTESAPQHAHSDPSELQDDIQKLALEMNEWRDTEAERFTRMREALTDDIPENDMEFVEGQIIDTIKGKLEAMENKPSREVMRGMLEDHFPDNELEGLLDLLGYKAGDSAADLPDGEKDPFELDEDAVMLGDIDSQNLDQLEALGVTLEEVKQLVNSYDRINSQTVQRRIFDEDWRPVHGPEYANDVMWVKEGDNATVLRKLPEAQLNMAPGALVSYLEDLIPNPFESNMPFEVVDTEAMDPNFVIERDHHGMTVAELLEATTNPQTPDRDPLDGGKPEATPFPREQVIDSLAHNNDRGMIEAALDVPGVYAQLIKYVQPVLSSDVPVPHGFDKAFAQALYDHMSPEAKEAAMGYDIDMEADYQTFIEACFHTGFENGVEPAFANYFEQMDEAQQILSRFEENRPEAVNAQEALVFEGPDATESTNVELGGATEIPPFPDDPADIPDWFNREDVTVEALIGSEYGAKIVGAMLHLEPQDLQAFPNFEHFQREVYTRIKETAQATGPTDMLILGPDFMAAAEVWYEQLLADNSELASQLPEADAFPSSPEVLEQEIKDIIRVVAGNTEVENPDGETPVVTGEEQTESTDQSTTIDSPEDLMGMEIEAIKEALQTLPIIPLQDGNVLTVNVLQDFPKYEALVEGLAQAIREKGAEGVDEAFIAWSKILIDEYGDQIEEAVEAQNEEKPEEDHFTFKRELSSLEDLHDFMTGFVRAEIVDSGTLRHHIGEDLRGQAERRLESVLEDEEAPVTEDGLEDLLRAGDPEQSRNALLSRPFDLGNGEFIQLSAFEDIDGFEEMVDGLLEDGNADEVVNNWYNTLLEGHPDIVSEVPTDFEPSMETLPQILTALVELGYVEADAVAPPASTEGAMNYTEFEQMQQGAATMESFDGKPVDEIKAFLENGTIKLTDGLLLNFSELSGVEGYDSALQSFAEFLHDRRGNKEAFETFLGEWMEQIKATTPDGKIGELPEDFTPNFRNFPELFGALSALPQVESSPLIKRPEKLIANPSAVDYASIPEFKFNTGQVEGLRNHPSPQAALAAHATSVLTEAVASRYEEWLNQEIQNAREEARSENEGEAGQSRSPEGILQGFTSIVEGSSSIDFPEEIRVLLGDELAAQLQNRDSIAQGKEGMMQLLRASVEQEGGRYFRSLDQGQLEDLMYTNTPLQFPRGFVEAHRHISTEDLVLMRDNLGYPGNPDKREEFGNLNKLLTYRHLHEGIPSWALDYGDPVSYAEEFSKYIQTEKNLVGNPYNPDFDPFGENPEAVFNTFVEEVMAKDENRIDGLMRMIHQFMTMWKELMEKLGLEEPKEGEKTVAQRREEFLNKKGIGETESQQESREASEALDRKIDELSQTEDYWTNFKLKDATPDQDFNTTDPESNNAQIRGDFLARNFSTMDELTAFENRFLSQPDLQTFTSEKLTIEGITDLIEGTEKIEVEGETMTLTIDEESEISVEISKTEFDDAPDGDAFIRETLETVEGEVDAAKEAEQNAELQTKLDNLYGDRLDGVTIVEVREAGLIEEGEDGDPDTLSPVLTTILGGPSEFWDPVSEAPEASEGDEEDESLEPAPEVEAEPTRLTAEQITKLGTKAGDITEASFAGNKLSIKFEEGGRDFDSIEGFTDWLS